jgi:hypothetical protein
MDTGGHEGAHLGTFNSFHQPMLLHFCSATLGPDEGTQMKPDTFEHDAESKAAVKPKLKAASDAEISTHVRNDVNTNTAEASC